MPVPPEPPRPIGYSPHTRGNRVARVLWSLVYVTAYRFSPRSFHRWRNWILRLFGARLHPTARAYPRVRFWAPWNLVMHEHSCLADDVDCYCVDTIEIGAYSVVSQYSYLCTATHDFEDVLHPLTHQPIRLGAHCWVAADVFVGPGVTIGDGTVVGARSSVFADLEAWVVAVGTPAKAIRKRGLGPDDYDTPPDDSPRPQEEEAPS